MDKFFDNNYGSLVQTQKKYIRIQLGFVTEV